MSESTTLAFSALTKDNYNTWRIQAEVLLRVFKLWDHIENNEFISKDRRRQALWIKNDEIAKSKLIQHLNRSLVPLVKNCKTSREVWLELAKVCGNKSGRYEASVVNSNIDDEESTEDNWHTSDSTSITENWDTDDEDAIMNDIMNTVDNFFDIISDLSAEPRTAKASQKSLNISKRFAESLLTRLRIMRIEKLPDEQIVVKTVRQFIGGLRRLDRIEIEERRNELSGELIDILLAKFKIYLQHKNGNDESESNAEGAITRDNDLNGRVVERDYRGLRQLIESQSRDIAGNRSAKTIRQNDIFTGNEGFIEDELEIHYGSWHEQHIDSHESIPSESYNQRAGAENSMGEWLNLYSPPPTPNPKRTYRCGVCGEEGHNRTRCPQSQPPKRSYKCGLCSLQGHNRTTCSLNQQSTAAAKISGTRKRSHKCSTCGLEGHNSRTCSRRETPALSCLPYSAPAQTSSTGRRSNSCGNCGGSGHNRRTCNRRENSSPYGDWSSALPSSRKSRRGQSCGICGRSGHNRRTCTV